MKPSPAAVKKQAKLTARRIAAGSQTLRHKYAQKPAPAAVVATEAG